MVEHESHKRSLVKAITWRIVASLTTFALALAFTGHFALSLGIGVGDLIAKFILYFIHERIWDRTSWGRVSQRV